MGQIEAVTEYGGTRDKWRNAWQRRQSTDIDESVEVDEDHS